MFRDVTVCLLGMLCYAPALGADCNIGEYTNGDVCTVCPEPYVHSMPNADGVNDCYLITAAGKYVPPAGMTEVACPENHYCPGGIPVFYGRADRLRRIEYIKSTGAQYIDTGILLGSDIDTELVFESGKISADNAIFGSWISERHYWLNGYNNMAYIRYNDYHPVVEAKAHLPADVRLILDVRHGDWILDGKTIYSNFGEFDVDKPGYLFAVNGSTGVRWIHKSLKVYSFTQWQKDKKVIELIPVYDSIKDECGMLDLVTGKLFENVGAGKFECGAFVDDIVGAGGAASCAAATDNVAPYSPAGTEDMSDCGRVLRFSGNYNLYLRSRPRTTHSLKVKIGGNIFYGDSTDKECGRLRVKYNGQTMSVCNMDSDV